MQQQSYSKIGALLRERRRGRWNRAIVCAQQVLSRLRSEGVDAVVIGSLASGNFMLHSDVDYLVLGSTRRGLRGRIEAVISHVMACSGIDYDIIYAEDVRPELIEDFCRAKLDAPGISKLAQESQQSHSRDDQPTSTY